MRLNKKGLWAVFLFWYPLLISTGLLFGVLFLSFYYSINWALLLLLPVSIGVSIDAYKSGCRNG